MQPEILTTRCNNWDNRNNVNIIVMMMIFFLNDKRIRVKSLARNLYFFLQNLIKLIEIPGKNFEKNIFLWSLSNPNGKVFAQWAMLIYKINCSCLSILKFMRTSIWLSWTNGLLPFVCYWDSKIDFFRLTIKFFSMNCIFKFDKLSIKKNSYLVAIQFLLCQFIA